MTQSRRTSLVRDLPQAILIQEQVLSFRAYALVSCIRLRTPAHVRQSKHTQCFQSWPHHRKVSRFSYD